MLKISFLFLLCFLLFACSDLNNEQSKQIIQGNTQGTTYTIIIAHSSKKVKKVNIDKLLNTFNLVLSNYNPQSLISKINKQNRDSIFIDNFGYFTNCYNKSQKIYNNTNGAFDPSVYPLVDQWGLFLKTNKDLPDSSQVDSILKFVNFTKARLHRFETISKNKILYKKSDSRFKIDFNAIAQGYAVDILANYLDRLMIKNYFIEIGGEIIVKGKNPEGKNWKIGIDRPIENGKERIIHNILSISNKSIATSGNYRKFYIKNGKKYSHTINPKTGYPVMHNLLSSTVVTKDCADADAYATAFMVMGLKETISFIKTHPELKLEIYLIYEDKNGELAEYYTKGIAKYLHKN